MIALQVSLKGFFIDTLSVYELHTDLVNMSENVFTKYSASAFDIDALLQFLVANNAKAICLVGRSTSQ